MSVCGKAERAMNRRGVALYLVLSILLVVVILANVVLSLINSQSKLTHHQVRRIQAYYAAQAGVNYALENLRLNVTGWMTTNAAGALPNITKYMCKATTSTWPCNAPTVIEDTLPATIRYIQIDVGSLNDTTGLRPVSTTVNYTAAN